MPLPEQYLVTTKNLDAFFNALINAEPPKKVTQKFLEQLEFKSTNDRLYIGVLKALGFIDQEGVPKSPYYEFIDQTQSKKVLAEAIREAYSDLFAINKKAWTLSGVEVKNKFKTLFQGDKSNNVLQLMANTFVELCKYAEFDSETETDTLAVTTGKTNDEKNPDKDDDSKTNDKNQGNTYELVNKEITTEMHYNIQIHLPETRDMAVYDAIFKSLKEHLL